mmetsp:Transcript_28881/g.68444  ORF Transcript_28881/g.68444 Transcript_28881/m.68444 type:complete len:342 (-) Transcript_28881:313-1338(-)
MSKTKFFFTLKAAGGEEESVAPGMGAVSDCAVQHHVLKFNPMDVHAIHELGHEWLFQKDIPPQTDWEKKKKLKNKEAHAEHERKTTWKRPWLISDTKDTEFKKAFLARRETDKKSKLNVIVNVTLTEVKAVCKGDEDLKRRLASTNNALAQLYKACEEAACGPGTDVFDMDVTTKKRAIDDKDTYKVTSMLVRIPAAHLKVLEEKQKEEAEKKKEEEDGKALLAWMKTALSSRVSEVEATHRLVDSPAIISEHDNVVTRRMMQMAEFKSLGVSKPAQYKLQVNLKHPILVALDEAKESDPEASKLVAEQLLDNAIISAGILDDVRDMLPRLSQLMTKALRK